MKRPELNLNLTSVIVIIAAGVLLPVLLSTAAGIVAVCMASNKSGIITSVLVISFTVTAGGCGLLALLFAGRKARLARQQADFIANISHELRTPLSVIKLYAQTLESKQLESSPEETAKCISTILRETAWLDVMIDRVLTWRASSKDMLTLSMEPRPVRNALAGAIDRFKSIIPPDEVSISTSIETELPVNHDQKALQTVILNLLTNAFKYSEPPKHVSVTARDRNSSVIIEVTDNGLGLTNEEAKHIFKPFYRAKKRETKDKDGVGLGLAIAWDLIQQHKGDISVSSIKNEGATFTISLPAAETP